MRISDWSSDVCSSDLPDVLQLLPGNGSIGAALVGAPETAAVIFTGSTEVARLIQKQLAGRLSVDNKPIPLIAETGGQNAMIVDSSALAEQVVADVIASAFDSAGQRCSRSEEHTSELQSLMRTSYAVFCLKK